MKRIETFTADDGSEFKTAAECTIYEKTTLLHEHLAGLTEEQVEAALTRTDVRLAGAIEHAGNIIARRRRESGGLKRKRKPGTGAGEDATPAASIPLGKKP